MRRFLSYITGWLCVLSWATFLGSCGVIIGNVIKYCCLVYFPEAPWAISQWFPTILAILFLVFGGLFNVYLARKFPVVESVMLFIHLAGWAAVVVTLWVTSPRGNASDVLFTFSNGGAWPNAGIATLVGVLTPWSSLIGYDSSVHMSKFLLVPAMRQRLKETNTLASRERKRCLSDDSAVIDDGLYI